MAMKHILESQQFDRPTLESIFALADSLDGTRNESLKGKILAGLFYEPSTRTRLSFESAMTRLGGSIITAENARDFSSAAKGETLEDTIRVVNAYADCVVLRHFEAGSATRASTVSSVPIINAGDGAGQHPSQALLDLYTIKRELGTIDGVHVALVGDLKNGRAARSLVYLLTRFSNIRLTFVAPPELAMLADIKTYLSKYNVSFVESQDLSAAMHSADVVYQTRIQKERFADSAEYERLKNSYIITRTLADGMKEKAIIMHPLPRVNEIETSVDTSPHAAYFRQVTYGVSVRMALLQMLLA